MSKRFWSWALAASLFVIGSELSFLTAWKLRAPKVEQVADVSNLYEASFLVRTSRGYGSGTVFRDKHGELLILTAAHVVKDEKQVLLVQTLVICGERLSGVSIDGDVIESDEVCDLALIRPHSAQAFLEWCKHVAVIYKGKSIPAATTQVIHIGSMKGVAGERSITYGTIAGIARPNPSGDAYLLDQMTAAAFPGSSGGGVFDARTGDLIGVLTQGYSDSFSFFVPARDINIFLKNTQH